MAEESIYVDAVMVAIVRGRSILTIYNDRWCGFALPMSKSRSRLDPADTSRQLPADAPPPREGSRPPAVARLTEETPADTAVRVAAEALGRPVGPEEMPEYRRDCSFPSYHPSLRDGKWKHYHYEVFVLEVGPNEVPRPLDGAPTAWLTLDEMAQVRPVTWTTLQAAEKFRENGIATEPR